jgi:hypothetical protein
MSFGAFLNGLMGGYQVGQNLQDQAQQRKLRDFKVKELEEEQGIKERIKGYDEQTRDMIRNVGIGLDGDGMGPQYTAPEAPTPEAPAPASTDPVDDSVMRAAPGETPVQVPIGVPGGPLAPVGPGQRPSPAQVEAAGATQAAAGVAPPQVAPKVTIMGAKKTPDFYAERIRVAKEKGDTKVVERFQEEQVKFLVNEVKRDAAQWEIDNADRNKRFKEAKTVAELRKIQEEEQEHQIRSSGTALYLWSIGAHDAAREASKHGSVFGPDWSLKEIRPGKEGMLEIVGADGKVAAEVTPEQVRQLVARSGAAGSAPEKPMLVPDGGVVYDPRTKQPIYENRKDPKQTPDQTLQKQNMVNTRLLQDFGLKSPTGEFLVPDEKKAEYQRVRSVAERMVREGMSVDEALDRAKAEVSKAAPASATGAPAPLPPAATKYYKPAGK